MPEKLLHCERRNETQFEESDAIEADPKDRVDNNTQPILGDLALSSPITLPLEIIQCILDQLISMLHKSDPSSREALMACSLVSRTLRKYLTPTIFHDARCYTPSRLYNLHSILVQNPGLAKSIYSLHLTQSPRWLPQPEPSDYWITKDPLIPSVLMLLLDHIRDLRLEVCCVRIRWVMFHGHVRSAFSSILRSGKLRSLHLRQLEVSPAFLDDIQDSLEFLELTGITLYHPRIVHNATVAEAPPKPSYPRFSSLRTLQVWYSFLAVQYLFETSPFPRLFPEMEDLIVEPVLLPLEASAVQWLVRRVPSLRRLSLGLKKALYRGAVATNALYGPFKEITLICHLNPMMVPHVIANFLQTVVSSSTLEILKLTIISVEGRLDDSLLSFIGASTWGGLDSALCGSEFPCLQAVILDFAGLLLREEEARSLQATLCERLPLISLHATIDLRFEF